MPLLKKWSDTSLARSLVILNSVQLLPIIYIFMLHLEDKEFRNVALPLGRHPLMRMPVFIMGIIAGLQTLRANSGEITEDESKRRTQTWSRRVYRTAFIYLAATIFLSMPQRLGAPKELRLLIRSYLFLHTKVLLMQGLVSDGGRSLVTRILSTRPLLFLGKISMAVYLYHVPVIQFLDYYHGGKREFSLQGNTPVKTLYSSFALLDPFLHHFLHLPVDQLLAGVQHGDLHLPSAAVIGEAALGGDGVLKIFT